MARLFEFPRKLTWSEIRKHYQGQWVQLHDVDWNMNVSTPRRARVRYAADDRDTVLANVRKDKPALESVILHINSFESFIAFEAAGAAA